MVDPDKVRATSRKRTRTRIPRTTGLLILPRISLDLVEIFRKYAPGFGASEAGDDAPEPDDDLFASIQAATEEERLVGTTCMAAQIYLAEKLRALDQKRVEHPKAKRGEIATTTSLEDFRDFVDIAKKETARFRQKLDLLKQNTVIWSSIEKAVSEYEDRAIQSTQDPSFDRLYFALRDFSAALEDIAEEESGSGAEVDRPQYQFFVSLKNIYGSLTGSAVTFSGTSIEEVGARKNFGLFVHDIEIELKRSVDRLARSDATWADRTMGGSLAKKMGKVLRGPDGKVLTENRIWTRDQIEAAKAFCEVDFPRWARLLASEERPARTHSPVGNSGVRRTTP